MVAEGLQRERDGDEAEGGFLAAHPVRSAVGRIARHPVLEGRPEEFGVAIGAVAKPGPDEDIGPGETGKLPDAFDVIRAGVAAARPMCVRIDGTAREHVARPAVGAADFGQAVREDPGITTGEGVRFGDRRMAGFERPRFERRREVGTVEPGDRQARGVGPPLRGIEAGGEILPRAERRTPLPEPELTLARPQRTPGEPARAEVMEEREEH